MQIDHLFIRTTPTAPEAELLRAFGITEGSGNHHPGQGTQNRRFFFHNAFIELLWIANKAEVTSAATAATMLHQRLSDPSTSPFGICFRPSPGQTGPGFSAWLAYSIGFLLLVIVTYSVSHARLVEEGASVRKIAILKIQECVTNINGNALPCVEDMK